MLDGMQQHCCAMAPYGIPAMRGPWGSRGDRGVVFGSASVPRAAAEAERAGEAAVGRDGRRGVFLVVAGVDYRT
jgi:hypothetical protein